MELKNKIIVALDVQTADEAREITRELSGHVGAFKIGLQLFTAAGAELVREFTKAGNKIFLDLKFHDIPNTVAKASVEAARSGVWMFNVHVSGGGEMMEQTVNQVDETCGREKIARPLIIGVTVLTSSNEEVLREVGAGENVEDQVVKLACLAAECGLDGVVASPHEVKAVRKAVSNNNFLTVTPGIRPTLATRDDHKRVTTFGQAIANGSDYVVIGRPIIKASDRLAAVEAIVGEI
ncbi:MAG: orotidine-5'-phosphate decarboxylase [Pyrinomonadaceae bacterium]